MGEEWRDQDDFLGKYQNRESITRHNVGTWQASSELKSLDASRNRSGKFRIQW